MAKANYRKRSEDARQSIVCQLDFVNGLLAEEAVNYLGKEFNTAKGWELSGRRKGITEAITILGEHNIY